MQFRDGDRDKDGIDDYAASLADLSQAGLIDNVLAAGTKSGYQFVVTGAGQSWQATATPVSAATGTRNFFIDTEGVVRFSSDAPATSRSPAVQ